MRLLSLALLLALGACADAPEAPPADPAPATDAPVSTPIVASADEAANRALGVGDRAPDFVLPDATGQSVRLSDLLLDGPVVVTFYRGAWCPYCNTQLRDYQQALGTFEAAGARLVAVSPQAPDSSMSMAERNDLDYFVLSDAGGTVSQDYGLVFRVDAETRDRYQAVGIDLTRYHGDPSEDAWALPVPATYVIDQSGTIRAAFVEADYTQRASPRQILEALREVA